MQSRDIVRGFYLPANPITI